MTSRTNLIIVVKVVDLDINCIYNCNHHMVGMDKISSSEFCSSLRLLTFVDHRKKIGSLHFFFFLMNFPYVKLVIYALRLKL
jgi:hypothetical protein